MDQHFKLTPISEGFAAEITQVNLAKDISPGLIADVHAAMDKYAALVFKDQKLDDDEQMAFGAALGTIEAKRATVDTGQNRLKHSSMNDISNLGSNGELLAADDRRRMFNLGNQLWHSDSSFKETPAMYSMLHARVIPPKGGETEIADMRAAWDELPSDTKDEIKDLIAEHSLLYSRAALGFTDFTDAEKEMFAPVQQRLVRYMTRTKRKSLFLSSHIGRIVGLPIPESLALVRDLVEHATDRRFVYRHNWQVNDLLMWDNRTTMHRGRPYADKRYPRDLRRVTTMDIAPTLQQQAA
jgi:alpha-ketoglutarate-dependent 2,4-dichlorophenoxyacetate dioxygenase